jgi:alpha-beta hydrolase superfamily lysophospholipase
MSCTFERVFYPSADGVNEIAAYVAAPEDGRVRGILQIVHGMSEYFLRYRPICEFLVTNGFVVCGNDHLGHGDTAQSEEDLGFFAEKDGADILASDVNALSELVRARYPKAPHILLGHSMGSLIARYCIAIYPDITDSAIIMGTVGPGNPASLAKLCARINGRLFGSFNRSATIKSLAFGSYTKRFPKEEGGLSWLSGDADVRREYEEDPNSGFTFTASGYYDLFDLTAKVNKKEWAESIDKSLPILLVSGRKDPCGDYGRGVVKVCEMLIGAGVENTRIKIYPESRHEILNDVEKDEVFADILSWAMGICDEIERLSADE